VIDTDTQTAACCKDLRLGGIPEPTPTLFLHVWQSSNGWHVSALEEALICLVIRKIIINSPLKLMRMVVRARRASDMAERRTTVMREAEQATDGQSDGGL